MPDLAFTEPRLAAIYDATDPDRSDLIAYLGIVDEIGGRSVLDLGCGTGTFALLLAARGLDVIAVDPAQASLQVARRKPGAHAVRWICCEAADLPPIRVDIFTMTGNVAQVFLSDDEWAAVLAASWQALRPGGRLVFETRDPAARGWEAWTRVASYRRIEVGGVGPVDTWAELTDVSPHTVSSAIRTSSITTGRC